MSLLLIFQHVLLCFWAVRKPKNLIQKLWISMRTCV